MTTSSSWRPVPEVWNLLLQTVAPAAQLVVLRRGEPVLDLAEGNRDGDALFFARDIDIEGDVSALLALRNALDGEGLDLIEEMVSPFGPLAAGVGGLVRRSLQLLLRISRAAPATVAAP